MSKFLENLGRALAEYAEYSAEMDKRIVETKSSTRADEAINLIMADTLRYCHREDYLEMASYLDGFERSVFLLKLSKVDYSLWWFIKNRLK